MGLPKKHWSDVSGLSASLLNPLSEDPDHDAIHESGIFAAMRQEPALCERTVLNSILIADLDDTSAVRKLVHIIPQYPRLRKGIEFLLKLLKMELYPDEVPPALAAMKLDADDLEKIFSQHLDQEMNGGETCCGVLTAEYVLMHLPFERVLPFLLGKVDNRRYIYARSRARKLLERRNEFSTVVKALISPSR
jgi:hypothetical protein